VAFNNAIFFHNFQQAFFATAMSLDPNAHFISDNITPFWPSWKETGENMLFNMTTMGAPLVKLIGKDNEQSERCA
jgi:hypothetical protein